MTEAEQRMADRLRREATAIMDTHPGASAAMQLAADFIEQLAEQRPVAYKHTESDGGMTYFVADEAPCEKCVPLYAAPVPPQREPVLIDLLTQAEKCLAAGVRVDQTAPDEPPMPVSEWDYEAERLSAEILAWMKVHGIGGSDER